MFLEGGLRSLADRLADLSPLAFTPKSLEVVELSGLFREDMNHEVGVVHQYPITFGMPFDVGRTDSGLSQSLVDIVGDRLGLPGGGARTYQEVVGKRTDAFKVQDDDISRLLVQSCVERCFQSVMECFVFVCRLGRKALLYS